jgi:molybdate transport system ATP-binding protein
MDELTRLADHLVLMDQGRVLARGPLSELLSRTDLPIGRQDEAGVVIQARVVEHDRPYGLTRIAFDGGSLWVGETDAAVGDPVRARVLARDVSVARVVPAQTSVVNVLPAVIESLHAEHSTVLLCLAVGDAQAAGAPARLLARITRRSCETLTLRPGDMLYAQIKGVALM